MLKRSYPYTPSAAGRWFGLLTALVVAVPIAAAAIALIKLDPFSAGQKSASPVTALGADGTLPAGADKTLFGILDSTTTGEPQGVVEQAPATPAPPSQPAVTTYVVKAGDTLGAIASRFGTTAQALALFNRLADPNALRVGQELKIPGPDFTVPAEPATTPTTPPPDQTEPKPVPPPAAPITQG